MANINNIGSFFSGMSPETRAALTQGGLNALGGVLKAQGQEGLARFQTGANLLSGGNDNSLVARQNAITQRSSDFNKRTEMENQNFLDKNKEIDAADRLISDHMGTSPLDFSNQRGAQMARAEIASKPMVPGYLRGQVPAFMANGLSPRTIAMMTPTAEKEQPYWDALAAGSKGRFKGAGLGASYGDEGLAVDQALAGTTSGAGQDFTKLWGDYETGFTQNWAAYEKERDEMLNQYVGLSDQQRADAKAMMDGVEQNKHKGGFWSKLGGIIKVVGPIAAMAIPAVGPIVAIAIAAGSSAAGTKMQGGSWGQALAAGGISGATQGILGGMGNPTGFVNKDVGSVASRIGALS